MCVCFPGPYAETQAVKKKTKKKQHSGASREMIDMGAFLVMYKNVSLIAAHSCGRALLENAETATSSSSPVAEQCVPPSTTTTTHKSQRSVWCTSSPFPVLPFLSPSSYSQSCSRLGTHVHTHTRWYAVKFNQMLNYILTWVLTSWLYSPASD